MVCNRVGRSLPRKFQYSEICDFNCRLVYTAIRGYHDRQSIIIMNLIGKLCRFWIKKEIKRLTKIL